MLSPYSRILWLFLPESVGQRSDRDPDGALPDVNIIDTRALRALAVAPIFLWWKVTPLGFRKFSCQVATLRLVNTSHLKI